MKRTRQSRIGFRQRKIRRVTRRKRKVGKNVVPRALRRLVENKVHDFGASITTLGTGFQLHNLTNISAGDDITQREGRKVTATSLNVTLHLKGRAASAFSTPVSVRWAVFVDKTPNQEAPIQSDLFNTTYPPVGPRQWNESFRYRMLKTGLLKVAPCAVNLDSIDAVKAEWPERLVQFTKAINLPIEWTTTTGSEATMSRNAIYFCCFASGASPYDGDVISRMKFVDL